MSASMEAILAKVRAKSDKPLTYAEAKIVKETVEREGKAAYAALNAFPRHSNGLPLEEVRVSPEYRAAKARGDAAFARERAVNAWFMKAFKKEYMAERRARGR